MEFELLTLRSARVANLWELRRGEFGERKSSCRSEFLICVFFFLFYLRGFSFCSCELQRIESYRPHKDALLV